MTVSEAARNTCTTGSVMGLSIQIIEEARSHNPNLLVQVRHPRIVAKYPYVYLWLQRYAAESLYRVVNHRPKSQLIVASCLRVLPGQYLLYHWYKQNRCNIRVAAKPGNSNHERGNAVDVSSYASWKEHFLAEGWRWLGPADPPHFDRVSGSSAVDEALVAAFQRLSNRYGGTNLTVDGNFGTKTESALHRAPAAGWKVTPSRPLPDPNDPERTWVKINGYDQTEAVRVWVERGVMKSAVKDLNAYYTYAPPVYDPETHTSSWNTDKVPPTGQEGGEED